MSSRPPEDEAETEAELEADAREEALADDEDRLPWLEPIEDEEDAGPSAGKLIGAVLIGLLAIGLIVGGLFWYGNRAAQSGDPEVIAAPDAPYKQRPDKEGGMQVDDKGSTQVATSDGREEVSSVNKDARPDSSVGQNTMAARPAPAPAAPAGAASRRKARSSLVRSGPDRPRIRGSIPPLSPPRHASGSWNLISLPVAGRRQRASSFRWNDGEPYSFTSMHGWPAARSRRHASGAAWPAARSR